ncbi:septum formation protein Maf [Oceanobacillus zhaokaii]|jgi:septum formation protein|uniref:dTTP/UTP pyrophosphatase n=1 Tax=Oceanobacillus zhaokaii TaxID=2052660 RepID=A0A345PFQ4_9BACI|nr:Maf family protein [Oceanobacillus zhaokaii]AXI08834.1 septum formation protein Maf [Oceanobacillus zhaokaii]
MTKKLILASSSPRRKELLKQVKIPFAFRKQDIDESLINTSDPLEKVQQLSLLKGNVPIEHKDEVILSADTVVSYNQKIFEKPKNKEDAIQMLTALSGDVHEVYTGVMIRSVDNEIVFAERTKVEFWPLTKDEIEWYISTNEPYDKAGAYGIQGIGAMFVKQIIGDYYNVMGLPISRVVRELRKFGVYPEESFIKGNN